VTATRIEAAVERGEKRCFAFALDWPGWCRSGKTPEAAMTALTEYADRYAPAAARARAGFPKAAAGHLTIVERLKGGATTDFGAPEAVAKADRAPMSPAEAKRLVALVRGAWHVLDEVAAGAPAALRKGPRGGGRDRDAMLEHVLGAERAYAGKLAIQVRQPAVGDTEAIEAMRRAICDALVAGRDGSLPKEKGWPARYAARRIAWHVLDHAWEMQDRSE
jgi:hypothetical protein